MGSISGNLIKNIISIRLPLIIGSVEKYLVPQPLAGNDGDLIAELLVDLKVEGELGIVPLNDNLSGPLNGLSPNATHVGELLLRSMARWCGCSKGNFGVVDFLPSSLNEHVSGVT